eukprot:CAMPEP_0180804728 /NCGR_PEP_ID=MMETSP1038_2-20121128/61620_1 /TAXON_ID=632150 /ORGANISM="Azadinium spinosum, Strain 3D9" /LENGTH=38 /DNA_ID= /DNA_START= /DNA_END= /DNA_ORIENTATION=
MCNGLLALALATPYKGRKWRMAGIGEVLLYTPGLAWQT